MSKVQDKTLFEALVEKLLGAGDCNLDVEVKPAAILWTDAEKQWEALIPRLRQKLPQLLILGAYEPAKRTGTSLWLRCMIERALVEETYWPDDAIPIVYLPGFSRQQLRDIPRCPEEIALLVELQYRGTMWHQVNGKDWTITALLMSKEGGLGLDVEKGDETKVALQKSLPRLADVTLKELAAQRISAQWLLEKMHPDFARDVLLWMDNPQQIRASWEGDFWDTFKAKCVKTVGIDPDKDGELEAARRLGLRDGKWQEYWQRFSESPESYPHIPTLLEKAKPKTKSGDLFAGAGESWPQDNRQCEQQLREELVEAVKLAAPKTREKLLELELEHAERRLWVWASLGQAPLSQCVKHLAELAKRTKTAFGGESTEIIAQQYVEWGWKADLAAIDAYAASGSEADRKAITAILQHIYWPWLDECIKRLQQVVAKQGYPIKPGNQPASPRLEDYTAHVFIDGLRFDLAQRLSGQLKAYGLEVELSWRWAVAPTVTATCKPLAMPNVAIDPASPTDTFFVPALKGKPKKADTSALHEVLKQQGIEVLTSAGDSLAVSNAWLECGKLDKLGHNENASMAVRIGTELRDAVERIKVLLDVGYTEAIVVTDHGWLLMPGGLPKDELSAAVVENKWGRCASLKQSAEPDAYVVGWHWNPAMQLAVARGATAFIAGKDYAHGGLSPQECIVPILKVHRSGVAMKDVRIGTIEWTRLKCTVIVVNGAGFFAEIRTKANESQSRCSEPKAINADEKTVLFLSDDLIEGQKAEGQEVYVVVLNTDKQVVDAQRTKVGEEHETS